MLLPNGYSVTTPSVVMRAIDSCWRLPSTNHRLWSGPVTIPLGLGFGIGNSVITPAGVMRTTFCTQNSVNQTLPSGPQVTPSAPTPLASGYLVTTPAGLTFRIQSGPFMEPRATIQTLPSGAPTIPSEPAPVAGTANWVIEPAGVTRPSRFCPTSKNHTFPSGPAVMPLRLAVPQPEHPEPGADGLGTGYSTTPPEASFGSTGVACAEGGAIGPEHAANSTRHTASAARMPVQTRRGAANYASPSSIWSNGPGNRHGSQD